MRKSFWRAGALCAMLLATAACGGENAFTNPGFGDDDPATGTIRGQVTAGGAAVGDVRIVLVGRDSVLTDGEGIYEFADIPTGTYTVSLRLPANYVLGIGESSSKTVDVAADGVATANWTLQQDAAGATADPPSR